MTPPTSPRLREDVLVERGEKSRVVDGRKLCREFDLSDEGSGPLVLEYSGGILEGGFERSTEEGGVKSLNPNSGGQ